MRHFTAKQKWMFVFTAALVAAVLLSMPFFVHWINELPIVSYYRLTKLEDVIASRHIYWEEGDEPILFAYQAYCETEETPTRKELRRAVTSLIAEDSERYYTLANLMLSHYDRYSKLVSEERYQQLYPDNESYGGLGMVVTANGPFIGVVQVYADSAAGHAGIQRGDNIVMVNDTDVRPLSYDAASELLSEVSRDGGSVTILREGEADLLTFVLTPAEVVIPNVDWTVQGETAYLNVTLFEGDTFMDLVDAAFADFRAAGARELVLDLRNNRGGKITHLVHLMDALTAEEDVLLFTEVKRSKTTEYRSTGIGMAFENVVVLVDENTCSSAEVCAGYMKDCGWAVVGTVTYGKGIGTSTYDFAGDALVLATIDVQLPVTGRYHEEGIHPTMLKPQEYPLLSLPELQPLSSDAVISEESEEEVIYALEQRLLLLGYMNGNPDGIWDAEIAAAVSSLTAYTSDGNTAELLCAMTEALQFARTFEDVQLAAAYNLLDEELHAAA